MPQPFDSTVVRAWTALALEALGEGREEIDAINVFPVADGDTGTNLQRTLEAAARALDAEWDADVPAATALGALARGALLGACGNSGTILAQLLHGMAETYGRGSGTTPGQHPGGEAGPGGSGRQLAAALRRAADSAYEAVAHPVEGTMLSVARAAARAAEQSAQQSAGADTGLAPRSGGESDGEPVAGSGSGPAAGGEPEPGRRADPGAPAVARAAYERAREALGETTGQLDVLRRAGVVDAGGSGLVAVLGALAEALGDPAAETAARTRRPYATVTSAGTSAGTANGPAGGGGPASDPAPDHHGEGGAYGEGGGAYEVMYLLDADADAVSGLRERLDALGDSLVVGGGEGLWSVHVHVDDAGAAVEAGIGAGRPHRIRITHLRASARTAPCAPPGNAPPGNADARSTAFGSTTPASTAPGGTTSVSTAAGAPADASADDPAEPSAEPRAERPRAVVAVVHGDGLAALCEEAGALVVPSADALAGPDGEPLAAAVRATGAAEVVLLPDDLGLHTAAARAVERARAADPALRVAVVPTRAAVQGLAALAVHDPERRFDDDVVAMANAAAATRYGEVAVADGPFWTMAGVCEAGDVLGLVEDDVAVIGRDIAATAGQVLERMLAAGGELVTLVTGADAPKGLTDELEEQVRARHLGVDTVVYEGRQTTSVLLLGVE